MLAKLLCMDFKAKMKMARLRAGFKSQRAAAEAIGCERGTVGMWEAPSSPTEGAGGALLLPICYAYKVHPDWLRGTSEDDRYPWVPDGLVVRGKASPEGSGQSLIPRRVLERLVDAIKLLQKLSELLDDPSITPASVDLLEIAYEAVASDQFALSENDMVVNAMRNVVAYRKRESKDVDERGKVERAGSPVGSEDGQRKAGKA